MAREYNLNKIFVEGESDKFFIDFILGKIFHIKDADIVVEVGGKNNLQNHVELLNVKRKAVNSRNLIIFDTDYLNEQSNGGRKKRIEEYQAIANKLATKFEIFLLPFDDETEGILEDLLNECLNAKFSFFDSCWDGMISCIKKSEFENINIPAKKAFLFSKIDLFKDYRKSRWDYKKSVLYDYSDDEIWNLDVGKNKSLQLLVNFIDKNLFN